MTARKLLRIYEECLARFGPQHWWPGETPFEVAVGAILTQNTNWGNVEKAITALKTSKRLNARSMNRMSRDALATLIRPAGYFNVKAGRLKNFLSLLFEDYGGSMRKMKAEKTQELRRKLLAVNGIGPETADSILLYAFGKPVFVIDAYTRRVLSRHGIMDHAAKYERYQQLFHDALRRDSRVFNEYHALFVRLAKEHCRTKPVCGGCPLEGV